MMGEELNILKALTEGTNTAGGYLVPEIWASKIYDLITAKSTGIQLCENATMTSDIMYFPKVTGASTAYWVAENATITASDQAFGQLTLTVKKIAALTQLSTEVMEDSNPTIANIVAQRLAEDIALEIDSQIYNCTAGGSLGTAGFRVGAGGSAVACAGADVSADDFATAVQALEVENIEPTDIVIHPKVLGKLRKLKTLTTGSNEPLLNLTTFGNTPLGNGIVGKIWGVNVITTTQLPANLTTTGGADTLSDALMVARGKCGIFANRRQLNLNRFYDINTDSWKLQSNMRLAFSVNYSKAITKITNIKTA